MHAKFSGGGYQALTRQQAVLTGSKCPDCVVITGIPVSEGGFARDMVLLIRNGVTGKTSSTRPPENAGYMPVLSFPRLTEGVGCDILLTVPTGGSGGIVNAYAYAYTGSAIILLFDSQQYDDEYQYTVTYLDNYRVSVDSRANAQQYLIDLSQRDKAYLSQIYRADGTLIQPIEGFVEPLSGIYPIDFAGTGTSELLTYQQVSGLYHADSLGYVQNVLKWDGTHFALDLQYLAIFGTAATQAE